MKYIISLLLAFVTLSVSAQELPERGEVRRGNKAYLQEDYAAAAESYMKAMSYSPDSFEPRFNLSNALFKGEQLEDAEKLLTEISADSLLTDLDRSAAYFNLGNSQFQQQKLKEALESYKNAMRFDPDDQEAKYNYAYTKALMEQDDQSDDQQQNDENQDNQEQDQDQNEDQQDQDQNEDQNDGEGDQDQQDQPQNDQEDQGEGEDEQPQGEQPQEPQMSEQQQQQMLDAVQAQEDKTQEDMEERARGIVVPGAKNW
ncbi:MAG: tetratricopeptide repeat protein [Rikenellaceae bacterium]